MVKVHLNKTSRVIEFADSNLSRGTMDGQAFAIDFTEIEPGSYSILYKNKSIRVEVVSYASENKTLVLRVNGKKANIRLESRLDLLITKLGMDVSKKAKQLDLKAPMPGLVLEVMVEVNQRVNQGDALVILEAMKMENILKSPSSGIIKDIKIKKTDAVEKNQVLLTFA